jgi:hypothetical protein
VLLFGAHALKAMEKMDHLFKNPDDANSREDEGKHAGYIA